jgi:hypothetical protein
MSKLSEVTVNEFVFEANRWSQNWLTDQIGAFAKDRFEYRESEAFEFKAKIREFTTQILERKLVEDSYPVYFNYKLPSSWWQHFKRDKAPEWFRNLYPVKLESKRVKRVVNITRKATYPMADIVVPKNMGQVVIKDITTPLEFFDE